MRNSIIRDSILAYTQIRTPVASKEYAMKMVNLLYTRKPPPIRHPHERPNTCIFMCTLRQESKQVHAYIHAEALKEMTVYLPKNHVYTLKAKHRGHTGLTGYCTLIKLYVQLFFVKLTGIYIQAKNKK